MARHSQSAYHLRRGGSGGRCGEETLVVALGRVMQMWVIYLLLWEEVVSELNDSHHR